MRFTSIDIGSNTALLLIADLHDDGRMKTVREEISFPRLGRGVWGALPSSDGSRAISPESIERVVDVLREYKKLSETLGSEKMIVCGTSALRESRNRDEVVQRIQEEVSVEVDVLSGDEEARWTFAGAISEYHGEEKRFAVIDIGGGSTEITLGTKTAIDRRVSLELGCVRLTERYLRSSPPSSAEIKSARAHVLKTLRDLGNPKPIGYELIGVAGTPTTLAALDLHLTRFEAEKVNGHVLSLKSINAIFEDLRWQTIDELVSSPLIPAGRADIIVAGTLILIEFMSLCRFHKIRVSTRGLRYGLILRELERSRARVGSY